MEKQTVTLRRYDFNNIQTMFQYKTMLEQLGYKVRIS